MSGIGFSVLVAYILGSIPTALIAGRMIGGYDIRTKGSGNAGATNVYRLFGLTPYLVVLSLDMLKGYLATMWVPELIGTDPLSPMRGMLLCGASAVIGHVFTLFARFKGGKGVATAGGMFLALAPVAALTAIGVYLAVTLSTRYVSLGSMTAATAAPVVLIIQRFGGNGAILPELIGMALLLAGFIIYTHRANIGRLFRGEEPRTDFLSRIRAKKGEKGGE